MTGDGEGLAGHAGAMLLRKLADRAGLTAAGLKISRTWPWKEAFLTCCQRLCTLPESA